MSHDKHFRFYSLWEGCRWKVLSKKLYNMNYISKRSLWLPGGQCRGDQTTKQRGKKKKKWISHRIALCLTSIFGPFYFCALCGLVKCNLGFIRVLFLPNWHLKNACLCGRIPTIIPASFNNICKAFLRDRHCGAKIIGTT